MYIASFVISFSPRDMHLESPIQNYALYHIIQRGVVRHGNHSFDAMQY